MAGVGSHRSGWSWMLASGLSIVIVFIAGRSCNHRPETSLSSAVLEKEPGTLVESQEDRVTLLNQRRHSERPLDIPKILLNGFCFSPTARNAIGSEIFEELQEATNKFRLDLASVELDQFMLVDTDEGQVIRIEPTTELKGLSVDYSLKLAKILEADRFTLLLQGLEEQILKISNHPRQISLLSEGEHHYITEEYFDKDNRLIAGSESLIESNKDRTQALERRYSHLIDFVEIRLRGEGTSLSKRNTSAN